MVPQSPYALPPLPMPPVTTICNLTNISLRMLGQEKCFGGCSISLLIHHWQYSVGFHRISWASCNRQAVLSSPSYCSAPAMPDILLKIPYIAGRWENLTCVDFIPCFAGISSPGMISEPVSRIPPCWVQKSLSMKNGWMPPISKNLVAYCQLPFSNSYIA